MLHENIDPKFALIVALVLVLILLAPTLKMKFENAMAVRRHNRRERRRIAREFGYMVGYFSPDMTQEEFLRRDAEATARIYERFNHTPSTVKK